MSGTLKTRALWARLRRTGIDRPLTLAITLGSLLLFAFVQLADEVMEGETHAFDEALLLALRTPGDPSQPIGPPWFQDTVRDFTALGSFGVLTLITLAATGWLVVSGRRRTGLMVLAAVIGGVTLSSLLKLGFARPRPELVPHSVPVFTNSFPSGHALMSAVVYLTLGFTLARTLRAPALKIYLLSVSLLITVIVGLSRVYLGVHWPSDVLAGWAIGACWALLCWLVMSRLQDTGQLEPEAGALE